MRAAIYIRQAVPDEKRLHDDMNACRSFALQHGWKVVRDEVDLGKSGLTGVDGRFGLNKLCEDAKAGQFDVVITPAMHHIGRSPAVVGEFVALMETLNIGVHVIK